MKTYVTVELEDGQGVDGQTYAFVASLKGSGATIIEATITHGEWDTKDVEEVGG